ncbi:MAG: CvpA family protein, partial [Patescibacteria group bacterium]
VLIAAIAFFVLSGWYYGFIQTLGNLVGMIAGLIAGGIIIVFLGDKFTVLEQPMVTVIVYMILVFVISRLVGWFFHLLDKFYKILAIIPFLKPINKLLGAVMGFFEGGALIIAITYLTNYFLPDGGLKDVLSASPIVHWLGWTMEFAQVIFPMIEYLG